MQQKCLALLLRRSGVVASGSAYAVGLEASCAESNADGEPGADGGARMLERQLGVGATLRSA